MNVHEFPRVTLAAAASFSGQALHGGQPARATVHPGADGIAFRTPSERIPAVPGSVSDTRRCTRLGSVSTVEHVLSALAGLGVTDAEIEVEGGELPALDGAAAEYVEGVLSAGLETIGTLAVEGPYARVFEKAEDGDVSIATGDGHWRYEFDCGARWPWRQVYETMIDPEAYRREIAPARTFGFEEELPMIEAAGLAKGLGPENALVLGQQGYLNPAKFEDEPVRHKMLDLIGDLALAGVPIRGLGVVALRSGHAANVRAAVKLAAAVRVERR